MKTLARVILVVGVAVLLPNCASSKQTAAASMRGARVVEVQTTVRNRPVTGVPAAFTATHMGIIGSTIGRGAASHVGGAVGGAIIGGIIGYIGERNASHSVTHTVKVKIDDGRYFQVQSPLKRGQQPYYPGQKVWMALDAYGIPLRIVDGPTM